MKKLFPIIRNSKKKLTVFDIVGFDVETYSKTNIFYMGGLFTINKGKETFNSFYSKEDMINFLLHKRHNGKFIVATNLGFDFNALFFNTSYWTKFKVIYSGSQMVACIYQPTEHLKITFIDTFNYVPYSVRVMGEILGIPKLSTPPFLGSKPKNEEEDLELLIYNKRDCEVTYHFMVFLQRGFNSIGGQLKMTIASTSMDTFRREFLKFPLQHESDKLDDEDFYDFLFSGYYGGRTEVFKRGTIKNLKMYDINSLYPSVMRREYPIPNSVRLIKNPKGKFVLPYFGISDVTVTAPKNIYYPYLPRRQDNKLIFGVGTWRGVYTHLELNRALSLGYKIDKFHKCYVYKKTFYPFRSFVNELYAKRLYYKRKNSPMQLVYKLLLNSLYGKFAQKKNTDIQFIDLDTMDEEEYRDFIEHNTNDKIFLNDNDKGFVVNDIDTRHNHVLPIFSIYTTAYARDILYDFIVKYNAVYCDTDSVITYDSMLEGENLGDMKVEYDIIEGIIVKPKMYILKIKTKKGIVDVVKLKGVPNRTRKTFTDILEGRTVSYTKFTKTKESIRRHMSPNTIIEMTKHVSLNDNKRIWEGDFNYSILEDSKPRSIETKDI